MSHNVSNRIKGHNYNLFCTFGIILPSVFKGISVLKHSSSHHQSEYHKMFILSLVPYSLYNHFKKCWVTEAFLYISFLSQLYLRLSPKTGNIIFTTSLTRHSCNQHINHWSYHFCGKGIFEHTFLSSTIMEIDEAFISFKLCFPKIQH